MERKINLESSYLCANLRAPLAINWWAYIRENKLTINFHTIANMHNKH